jgi:protein-disulfide isomerase
VIVEYLDLECPACKALHPTIRQLEQDFESDLLVVTRHLPLTSVHPRAFDAAIASEAADRQGMFDEMVDKLFETQGEPGEWTDPAVIFQARIEVYALELGLDLGQFRADQADPALVDRVNRDLDSAASLEATATPTVYLNGVKIESPLMNVGDYADLIQDELDAFDDPFLLNRDNGDIIVADSGQLDFETNPTFTLEICATNGSTQQITSTINLIDVAE